MTWLWLFNGTNFIASGTNNWLELNDVQPSNQARIRGRHQSVRRGNQLAGQA